MKIKVGSKGKVRLYDLEGGSVIKYCGSLHLVTSGPDGDPVHRKVINLLTGFTTHLSHDELVEDVTQYCTLVREA